jgi:hypothetical protein
LTAAQQIIDARPALWPLTSRQVGYLGLPDPAAPWTSKAEFDRLADIIVRGRRAGRIAWEAIVDPNVSTYAPAVFDNAVDFLRCARDEAEVMLVDRRHGQIGLELILEARGMIPQLQGLVDEFGGRLHSKGGQASVGILHDVARRAVAHFEATGFPTLVMFSGDADPSGHRIVESQREDLAQFAVDYGQPDAVIAVWAMLRPEQYPQAQAYTVVKTDKRTGRTWTELHRELDSVDPATIVAVHRRIIETVTDQTTRDRVLGFETGERRRAVAALDVAIDHAQP